jgi:uncharacterized protein YdeI (YjbR/CyaY-like superfamily)
MMALDSSRAVLVRQAVDFDSWLAAHSVTDVEFIAAIYNKRTGKQTVGFDALLDVALCHGWIDVMTKRIDDETYSIRFVPRRDGSTWSPTNRDRARRLVREVRMRPSGAARLPPDLHIEVETSPGD